MFCNATYQTSALSQHLGMHFALLTVTFIEDPGIFTGPHAPRGWEWGGGGGGGGVREVLSKVAT